MYKFLSSADNIKFLFFCNMPQIETDGAVISQHFWSINYWILAVNSIFLFVQEIQTILCKNPHSISNGHLAVGMDNQLCFTIIITCTSIQATNSLKCKIHNADFYNDNPTKTDWLQISSLIYITNKNDCRKS